MVSAHETFRVIHKGIEYEFEAAEAGLTPEEFLERLRKL